MAEDETLGIYPYGEFFEKGFPEGSNMKAPGDSDFPFGAFLEFLSLNHLLNFHSKNKRDFPGL
jgi:hypothetical protein